MIEEIKTELRRHSSPAHAELLQRYFKTGPGEYGEGDVFMGLKVPSIRKTAAKFYKLDMADIKKLIASPYHEERMAALFILIYQFKKSGEEVKKKIVEFYLKNRKYINNWDLVDLTAPHILGAYYIDKDRSLLYDFVKTGTLWEKRIAVMATFYFIKMGDFSSTFEFTEMLIDDKRDLINKVCGWMLREIGKRDLETEEEFLKENYHDMPRTMLRYAIEKFPEEKRLAYLRGKVY